MVFLLSGVIISSCKKDNDKDQTVTDDPRIRTMTVSALPATFVVNDVEGVIFNYDSLSYGTVIDSLHPVFAGYGGMLSFQYKYGNNGEWEEYSNSGKTSLKFDSTLAVFFKSTAPDSKYTKEYKIDIRVHEYDVEAFTWENKGTFSVLGTVVSQKVVFYDQKFYFFYRNNLGKSYVMVSKDWKDEDKVWGWAPAVEIDMDDPDWTTLTSFYQPQRLVVQSGGGLYECNLSKPSVFTPFDVELPKSITLKAPLFTLGNKFWVIASQADSTFLFSLADSAMMYQKGVALSSRVPVEKITTFVSPSGSTTLGYIFGGKGTNGNGTVWGVDVNGNIIELTQNQSVFPHLIYPAPLFFGNRLYITGGIDSGKYTSQFYVSSNSGATWSKDSHKILPDQTGSMAKGAIFEYERNKIVFIGGENEKGFLPNVWKGTLNREILDEILNKP